MRKWGVREKMGSKRRRIERRSGVREVVWSKLWGMREESRLGV